MTGNKGLIKILNNSAVKRVQLTVNGRDIKSARREIETHVLMQENEPELWETKNIKTLYFGISVEHQARDYGVWAIVARVEGIAGEESISYLGEPTTHIIGNLVKLNGHPETLWNWSHMGLPYGGERHLAQIVRDTSAAARYVGYGADKILWLPKWTWS